MEELNQKRRFKYFMAGDQHKKYSKVAVIDDEGALIEEEKLNHFDRQSMYDYFKSYTCDKTRVVLEATGSWYWQASLLEEARLENIILAHPYKTRIIAESKIKTDSIDAKLLAQLNRADLIPEEASKASKQTRSLREELRYRISLVKIRSSLKCKVHSLLEKEGINSPLISDLFGKRGLEWLSSIELPPASSCALRGYLKLIEHLTKLINHIEISIKEKVKESP
ncbi:MAG: transposase [Candidatus Omnitrophica bacterium]|nr:transposase [Candidatus Omnitrophota bacterium]